MVPTTTRILFVGGSYAGLTSLKYFVKEFIASSVDPSIRVEAFLIDPRAGFINVLGIPKAILSVDFAKNIYLNVEKYNLKFASVESTDEDFKSKALAAEVNQELPENLKIHFIHGKCISFIDNHTINYQLNNDEQTKQLSFDYTLFATGRSRPWPMDPLALTEEDFSKEITIIKPKIEAAKTITVVGAGALGIEVAGEIKDTYRDKHVILIHPHGYIPPEVYAAKNFISALGEQVHEVGVDLRLNTRVKKELENGNLITTNDEVIESDLTLWCHSHTNNIEPLLPFFQDSIDLKSNEVIVDTNMLVKGYDNVFVAGDVTNFPIIKTAGGAFRQGEKVAQTLLNFIVKGEKVYERINLDEWPRGMTVVVGVHRSVTQWDDTSDEGKGKVISNDKEVLEFYADYCTNNTRLLLNINE